MVATRGKAATVEASAIHWKQVRDRRRGSPSSPPPPQAALSLTAPASPADYERLRGERIKENMERLRSFGILDLSLQLKSHLPPNPSPQRRRRRGDVTGNFGAKKFLISSTSKRRSSRLQNVAPVSYAENGHKNLNFKKSNSVEAGAKEEVYAVEHEKLLGTFETSWTLLVDGYGKDGRRIYDPINGKTCHQCRQKTLAHHTHCSKCQLLQGQFCGNCLFTRYGENILEISKNPNWICPVCRGICNCSLCRIKKGLIPTGILYKKVVNLGYKSVAHYLIQTQQQQTISGDLSSPKSTSAEDSSCVHNDPEENKSKVETRKITEEIYSSIEAGVISSDEHSAKNAAAKKANKSLEDVNPAIGSIASRLRKRNIA
ncbi:uncharacterized protein LOC121982323 [Zingiber officinale]|uniref:Zinc-finger domain-containing protein n=1 Tax=Zingiber officinale TaxID=94328 RepID=A0A8J5GSB5_ZINOF|nr:uncharacterized protein LOC121982322 [Zingiber officinale]XP_042391274.1 uncharacterized protein LOC121982323 [Zingiber officinale]KAG6509020.1 hypothetical protein ZIOFF_034407 [Zingiber officinale]KAG6509026.1 hypothetical protein ZIOFF_034413 [Zingiber officinale]